MNRGANGHTVAEVSPRNRTEGSNSSPTSDTSEAEAVVVSVCLSLSFVVLGNKPKSALPLSYIPVFFLF